MVNNGHESGKKIEEILAELSQDAKVLRLTGLQDACTQALVQLEDLVVNAKVESSQLRESCFFPFKTALESRSVKLATMAVTGLQRLISDERFHSKLLNEVEELRFPIQFLNTVASTPSLSDEVQVEVMKLLMLITSSESCEIHGDQLIKFSEMCMETYVRAHQTPTKTACKATLNQMLSSVCNRYQESTFQRISQVKKNLNMAERNRIYCQDVVTLLKHFCYKLNPSNTVSYHQQALTLCLESMQLVLANLSISIQQDADFITLVCQTICPALDHLVNLNDLEPPRNLNDEVNHNKAQGTLNRFLIPVVPKLVYAIIFDIIRLAGTQSKIRRTLEPMFARVSLCTQPSIRIEALKVLKEVVGNPQRIFDLAGPTQKRTEDYSIESQKLDNELFKIIMASINDSSKQNDACVSGASVSCIVAFLGTLEDLSTGRGLNDSQVEALSKVKDPENFFDMYNRSENQLSSALSNGNLSDSESSQSDDSENPREKPKHIRWQMDYEREIEGEETTENNEESQYTNMLTKTVTWAQSNEEKPIDSKVDVTLQRGKPKAENRKSSIPKLKSSYPPVKAKTDSGLKKVKKNDLKQKTNILYRSLSSIDLRPNDPTTTEPVEIFHPLRRTKSASFLEIKPRRKYHDTSIVQVEYGFFYKYWRRNSPKEKKQMIEKSTDYDSKKDDSKNPKPILRRVKSFNEDKVKESENLEIKPTRLEIVKTLEENTSPSKETTINGIPLSKLPRQQRSKLPKKKPPKLKMATINTPKENEVLTEPEKSVEEVEKEGAKNFARCLLGILPSVLAATEPASADELLQQFASDVCEAVTCMALKRKNVPNFGIVRTHDMKNENTEDSDPSLNADGVYKTVYETLKLSYKLTQSGFFNLRENKPPISQEEFVDSIIHSGLPVRLSRVWLSEVYRLATTYDILSKAGCKPESRESNKALIGILSEKIYTQHPSRIKENDAAPYYVGSENIPPAKREGIRFSRRLLLSTWDQVLGILSIPLDTNSRVKAGNGTVGLALMLNGIGSPNTNRQLSMERDLVCLTLDGFRRAARLCCALDIQSRCDTILSRLSEASCTDYFDEKRHRSGKFPDSVKLHAAHVLSMDTLLASGLELGSNSPQAWAHVFRCCMYISNLEHASFSDSPNKSIKLNSLSSSTEEICNKDTSFDSNSSSKSLVNGVLNSEDASRAVYALSSAVDNLFDMAATTLPIKSFKGFLKALTEASYQQLFGKDSRFTAMDTKSAQNTKSIQQQMITLNTLHLYHICDVMLRCARNNNRPLLHVMEAWSIISSHLVEAAYHRARHVSKVALTSIHDILSEMLKRRNELPHFWFYDTLFMPFNTLMALDTCDDEIQDQILYTLFELVEGFGQSIKSGWRSLLRALSNTQISNRQSLEEFNDSEQRQKLVFSIIEHFVNIKSNSVFASSVVSALLCLLKFLRGGANDKEDSFEKSFDKDSSLKSDTESNTSDFSNAMELCGPILNIILQISKKLSSIYIQPSSSIFNGSYSILLVNMTESQDRVWDDTWSQSKSTSASDSEGKISPISAAKSIVAIDDTGILRVWFLLLEGLTTNVATSPQRFQPMIIEILFEILRSVTTVPGPHFSMFAISNLLLPMLRSWVQRGSRKKSYWENTLTNFKHACGLATQLVVEEIGHFLTVEGAENCVPIMLKQLLDLFQECIVQPNEAIARTGCSCLRHMLLSAGPQFTEELWDILCSGIKRIFNSTLSPVRELISCFRHGSTSVSGDNGIHVKVVARRDSNPQECMRLLQIAEQVFLLESQLKELPSRSDSSFDEDDNRSFIFLLSTDRTKADNIKTRISFRGLTVSLLCSEILTQTLGSILLESADSIRGSILSNITESGLIKRNKEDNSLPGLLCYLSPINLGILFDCLTTTYNVANDYNNRPGLRSLVQKLARFTQSTNLLRQSITAFAIYLNTLFQISRHDGENFSISSIKRILTGEKVFLDGNHDYSPSSDSTTRALNEDKYRNLLKGEGNIDWIIKRLFDACNQISTTYQTLHQSETFIEQDSGFLDITFQSPQISPKKDLDFSEECVDLTTLNTSVHKGIKFSSPFRQIKKGLEQTDPSKSQIHQLRKKKDEAVHLYAWSQLIVSMLELLLGLPTLQFKSVLPAVFPAVTSLINNVHDPKVRQLVCDVVRRCGSIYGII